MWKAQICKSNYPLITCYFDKKNSNFITCISILSKQLSGKDGLDGDICIGYIIYRMQEQKVEQLNAFGKIIIKKVGCNVVDLNIKKIKDNGGKENG